MRRRWSVRRGNGRVRRRVTLAGDNAYDVAAFVGDLRRRRVSGKSRKTCIDKRTTRHVGYAVSQTCRKRFEEAFGWIKASARQDKIKFRGVERGRARFILALAADHFLQLP